jgi:putative phosphoesterase
MRIAIVSDIHGNLPALEAVAKHIKRQSVDLIVNLGDSLSGPLLPLETAQYLMAAGWLSLAGNHERQILTHSANPRSASDDYAYSQLGEPEFAWLHAQPATHQLSEDVFLCHGTPSDDRHYFLEHVIEGGTRPATETEIEQRKEGVLSPVIACGHTHIARSVRSKDLQLLCNPGSVGLPAYDDNHPIDHVVETGSPDARYAIIERDDSGWHAGLFTVPYNFNLAAQLAELRKRPEWAYALRTGYMPRSSGLVTSPHPLIHAH